jgi:hypothetical protein
LDDKGESQIDLKMGHHAVFESDMSTILSKLKQYQIDVHIKTPVIRRVRIIRDKNLNANESDKLATLKNTAEEMEKKADCDPDELQFFKEFIEMRKNAIVDRSKRISRPSYAVTQTQKEEFAAQQEAMMKWEALQKLQKQKEKRESTNRSEIPSKKKAKTK